MDFRRRTAAIVVGMLAVTTATVGTDSAAAADEPIAEVSVAPLSVLERDGGQRTVEVFVATIPEAVGHDVVFRATTRNETARAGSDYQFFTRRIVIRAGETSRDIPVRLIGDHDIEGTETFRLELTAPGPGLTLLTPIVSAEIIDNEPVQLTVSVEDQRVTERGIEVTENGTARPPQFGSLVALRFNARVTETVTVTWRTVDSTAIGGEHYVAASGTTTVSPNVWRDGAFPTSRSLGIKLSPNDKIPEPDREFTVEIVEVSGPVVIDKGSATIQIMDDDYVPTLVVQAADVVEGDSGTSAARVSISIDRPFESNIWMRVVQMDGTAVGGQPNQNGRDFVNFYRRKENGEIRFVLRPGTVERGVLIPIKGDTDVEDDEFFTIRIEGVRNALRPLDDAVSITILNDD